MNATTRILPDLPEQFMPPVGWQDGTFSNDGRSLVYGYVLPQGKPRACVLILMGRAEFREKYFETIRDLLARDLAVFIMDWHGQGSSGRYLSNTHKDHSRGFDLHVADLNAFIRDVVTSSLEKLGHGGTPLVMLSHSMGGHIGLRYLLTLQQSFVGAVMASPMMGIHGLTDKPAWLLETMMVGLTPFSTIYAPVPWHGDWNEKQAAPPGAGPLSSDPLRDSVLRSWYRANPHLQLGGPTWGWVNHALQSCAVVNDDQLLKQVNVPTLFITAAEEQVVDNAATLQVAAKIPGARQVEIAGARHEILMERDDMRNLGFEYFDKFLPDCKIR
jgi:lysophospholipase